MSSATDLIRRYLSLQDTLDTQENAPDAVYEQTLDLIDQARDAISEYAGTPTWHITHQADGPVLVVHDGPASTERAFALGQEA